MTAMPGGSRKRPPARPPISITRTPGRCWKSGSAARRRCSTSGAPSTSTRWSSVTVTRAAACLTLRLWVQQDANWNVTALVNAAGSVVERYVYDPYGAVTYLNATWGVIASSAYGFVYLFQGDRLDPASGLYNSRNRDYSPTLGRWIQQDPLRYGAGTMNLYQMEGDGPAAEDSPNRLRTPL